MAVTCLNPATALLDAREMGEADGLTVDAGTSVRELMEYAGSGVAQEVARRWSVRRVTVLRGPGNNGGDGFVADILKRPVGTCGSPCSARVTA